MNEISKEKIQWLHDAATEFASTGMKMTMSPDTVLQLTTPLLALGERAEPVAWTEKCEITNMLATGLYLRGFPDSSQGRNIPLYTAPPAPVVPEGWVLVPKESTQEMCDAVLGCACFTDDGSGARYIFEEMVKHAPKFDLGWIACSKRMPPENTGVLVAKELDGPGDWRMKWGTRAPGHPDSKNGWLIPGASWAPSHWMPLPEPPH